METIWIAAERKNKAEPPHLNVELKEGLSMKWFKKGFCEVDKGLKGHEALRVY